MLTCVSFIASSRLSFSRSWINSLKYILISGLAESTYKQWIQVWVSGVCFLGLREVISHSWHVRGMVVPELLAVLPLFVSSPSGALGSSVLVLSSPCQHVEIRICSFLLQPHIHQVHRGSANLSRLATPPHSSSQIIWPWFVLRQRDYQGKRQSREAARNGAKSTVHHSPSSGFSCLSPPEQRGWCAAARRPDESSHWALHGKKQLTCPSQ